MRKRPKWSINVHFGQEYLRTGGLALSQNACLQFAISIQSISLHSG